ncbi:hypothetical protein [Streptomyces sp. ISL-94]|uniref:hypothetical protein n=1 Tax=Streptomyces sp. ISL-94 TaxID=2819190 RepID=UPI002035FC9A|nr:hypothetical protein [Streptomyces sp. ISL-94]
MQTWRDAWGRADNAAQSIRAALTTLGVPESVWGSLRPIVTHAGGAYVDLGKLPADVVEQIAETLRHPVTSA